MMAFGLLTKHHMGGLAFIELGCDLTVGEGHAVEWTLVHHGPQLTNQMLLIHVLLVG